MEKKFFRVEGDAVHLVTERIERTVRLSDLMGEVVRESGVTTPILPLGCRFYSSRGERSIFVIEQSLTTRTIKWVNMGRDNGKWKLAFPFVIFVITTNGEVISNQRVFFRTTPLGSVDDVLLSTNLGNTHLNGTMCTGSMRVVGSTPSQKAEGFVAEFWRSAWNTDINESWSAHQHIQEVSSLARWEEESVKNPFFPLSVKWRDYGKLADVIEGRC
jgi:hypothetical protein